MSEIHNTDSTIIPSKDLEITTKLKELHGLSYNIIEYQIQGLEGEILTIVDASTSDQEQRKAQKDLVKSMFRKKYNWLRELCYPVKG